MFLIILEFMIRLRGESLLCFTEEEKSCCLKIKNDALRKRIYSSFAANAIVRVTVLAVIKQTESNAIQSSNHMFLSY